MDAMTIFARAYGNSRNIITDERLKLFSYAGSWAIELSTGTLGEDQLYGVTVVKMFPDMNIRKMHSMGTVFESLDEANHYIRNALRDKMHLFDLKSKMQSTRKYTTRSSIFDH